MPKPARLPSTKLPIERHTLANGLKVVLAPDRSVPAIAVVVNYDVGFRSEPEGRTGFAHLFEHLMFQGSATLEKGDADKLIEGNGGYSNGSTHPDYTNYISMLPSNALELALFIEADRMRAARLSDETLQNQIDVVKEEIRVNVLNRPYGGFPWLDLPPIAFETFHNAHNGYGSFVDLESATLDDVSDFFDRYYAPANAMLAVAGDFTVDDVMQIIERQFGDIAARPAPPVPDVSEKLPTSERRGSKVDPLAPMPVLAAGYRVPDPVGELDDFLAALLLVEVLAEGDASRLHRRLVREDRVATHVNGMLGTFGDPFDGRDPVLLQLMAYHPDHSANEVLDAIDSEVDRLPKDLTDEEVHRARTAIVSAHLRRLDSLLQRTQLVATIEQQHGRAELLNELPDRLAAVSADDVIESAKRWLQPNTRAVLEVEPGAAAR